MQECVAQVDEVVERLGDLPVERQLIGRTQELRIAGATQQFQRRDDAWLTHRERGRSMPSTFGPAHDIAGVAPRHALRAIFVTVIQRAETGVLHCQSHGDDQPAPATMIGRGEVRLCS